MGNTILKVEPRATRQAETITIHNVPEVVKKKDLPKVLRQYSHAMFSDS